jgi:hypothetical protein
MRNFIACTCHQILIRVIKSRRMRWAVHVARPRGRKVHSEFLSENLKGTEHMEELGLSGKIILRIKFN